MMNDVWKYMSMKLLTQSHLLLVIVFIINIYQKCDSLGEFGPKNKDCQFKLKFGTHVVNTFFAS